MQERNNAIDLLKAKAKKRKEKVRELQREMAYYRGKGAVQEQRDHSNHESKRVSNVASDEERKTKLSSQSRVKEIETIPMRDADLREPLILNPKTPENYTIEQR